MVEITDPDRYRDPISRSSAPGRARRQISWKFVLSLSLADAPGLTNGGDFPNGAQALRRVSVKRCLLVGRKTFSFLLGVAGGGGESEIDEEDVLWRFFCGILPSDSCCRRRKV